MEGGKVEYFHLLLDTHEIVFAEGTPCESFDPGEVGMRSFSDETREQIFSKFPKLRADIGQYGPTARRVIKSYAATLLEASSGALVKDVASELMAA